MARGRKKKGAPGIQRELIKGARQKKPLPEELQDLLEPMCEAIHNSATYKTQENEYKAQVQGLMGQHKLSEISLPNGGKMLYKPGEPSVQYIAPKAAKVAANAESGNGDDTEADE